MDLATGAHSNGFPRIIAHRVRDKYDGVRRREGNLIWPHLRRDIHRTFDTRLLVLTRLYATHQFDLRGKRTIANRHSDVSSSIGGPQEGSQKIVDKLGEAFLCPMSASWAKSARNMCLDASSLSPGSHSVSVRIIGSLHPLQAMGELLMRTMSTGDFPDEFSHQ